MKIKIIKPHPSYPGKKYEVTAQRAEYLIRTGHAVKLEKGTKTKKADKPKTKKRETPKTEKKEAKPKSKK